MHLRSGTAGGPTRRRFMRRCGTSSRCRRREHDRWIATPDVSRRFARYISCPYAVYRMALGNHYVTEAQLRSAIGCPPDMAFLVCGRTNESWVRRDFEWPPSPIEMAWKVNW